MKSFEDSLRDHYTGRHEQQLNKSISEWKTSHPQEDQWLTNAYDSHVIPELLDIDSQQAWKAVSSQMQATPTVFAINMRWASIAAALLALIAAILWMWKSDFTQEITYTTDTLSSISLPDGSTVLASAGTTLRYPRHCDDAQRMIYLQSGKAFFEVKEDADRPFVVETSHAKIQVTGTSFYVLYESDHTNVNVKTGSVRLTAHEDTLSLRAGEAATSDGYSATSLPQLSSNVFAWHTGHFVFENAPLVQVVSELNQYYEGHLTISPSTKQTCPITATFSQLSISEVVLMLSKLCNLSVSEQGKDFVLSEK